MLLLLLSRFSHVQPYDPAIPLLGIYPEETKIEKDTYIPLFVAALFTTARTWKQPRCPSTDEWVKKLWYIEQGPQTPHRLSPTPCSLAGAFIGGALMEAT